ncbi:hypothetical protein LN042_17725 [Kitasatospora sp. RB6PN24]|uniref:hypothetical protein n=1 Tax=Kitasatospora humi TaxID=2893891 RepID=UPI001E400C57|nr:hypothetical protein [Kitasatospora humi]MCC9308904.1 hypothetical protein [Kitasatospora humi]
MTASMLTPQIEARFAAVRQLADAVLFEGYVLYPYRASAAKNRLRWQFGVLAPPNWGIGHGEHSSQRTECLLEPCGDAMLFAELRFLRAQRRTVQRAESSGEFTTVDELELPDRVLTPWDEGVEEHVQVALPVADLADQPRILPFSRPAGEETEEVLDGDGRPVGRLVRRRAELTGELRISCVELPGPYGVRKLTVEVANTAAWQPDPDADREAALPRSLVCAHLLLGLDRGRFLSPTDPPEWARPATADCANAHTWPVLAGEPGSDDLLLSAPIILEDHAAIAPESPGVLYDALEIDEILTLRTAALTDREKREARGTDARAAAVIELADTLPPQVMERLHGAVRSLRETTEPAAAADPEGALERLLSPDTPWWDPEADAGVDPQRDTVLVDGQAIGAGSRVLLRPGQRRTDAQDLFLQGRSALVEAVLHDVDGGVHLAVTVDGDPGADIRREQGRFLYFQPDEVAPVVET